MQGLGNDFVIVDNRFKKMNFSGNLIKKLSNRNYGIGFDQLLLVEKNRDKNFDFFYRIFNSNGKEVEQCGNGARCFARFLIIKNITKKKLIRVQTVKKNIRMLILDEDLVKVDMGEPSFLPQEIPFLHSYQTNNKYFFNFYNKKLCFGVVSIGNPHCVLFFNNIKNINVLKLGRLIQSSKLFPNGVNVNFVEKLSCNEINLRVCERGVKKETKACGSGACASVAVGIRSKLLSSKVPVKVNLLGGSLYISWKEKASNIFMTGSSSHVFDGEIEINEF